MVQHPNRLIGDANLPEDVEWAPPSGAIGPGFKAGERLAAWPAWLLADKPSPTGRYTFTTWKLWEKQSRLLTSGLLGPVTASLERAFTVPIASAPAK